MKEANTLVATGELIRRGYAPPESSAAEAEYQQLLWSLELLGSPSVRTAAKNVVDWLKDINDSDAYRATSPGLPIFEQLVEQMRTDLQSTDCSSGTSGS
jgi:hypothetical protein